MGKKSRKQAAVAAEKPRLGKSLSDKATCRFVDELCEKTTKRTCSSSPVVTQSLWADYDNIIGLVKTIQQRQGASPVPLPAREEGMCAFEQWAKEQGIQSDSVELAEFPVVGFGLRATKMLEERERVLVVPRSAMLTVQSAREGPLKSFISQQLLLNAMPNLALAIHLLNERYTVDSKWKPYINVLPHTFCLPLYFTREELEEMQSSPALFEALSQIKNIARLYSILHRDLRTLADPSIALCTVGFHYTDFIWAVSSVMSRVNKIPIVGTTDYTLSLVPYWDMANHTSGTILSDYDPETSSLQCYSIYQYTPGDEFKIFYGLRSNADLLLNSGFVYADNHHDTVKIKLGLSNAEEESTQKLRSQLLQTLSIKLSTHYNISVGETPFPVELQAFARVFTASPAQLQQWVHLSLADLRELLCTSEWTSQDIRALQYLKMRCSLLVRTYKTTAEEDEAILATPGLTDCHQQVVKLRMCEKKLLQAASLQAGEEERLARELEKSASKQEKTTNSEEVSNGKEALETAGKKDMDTALDKETLNGVEIQAVTGNNDIPPDDS